MPHLQTNVEQPLLINVTNINQENESEYQIINKNKNLLLDKIGFLNNLVFFTGNTIATIGNSLLWYNDILSVGPAACFIIDGTIGGFTSLSRAVIYKFDYKNKTVNNILTWINIAQFSLLDAAVIQLNLPLPLNQKYASVWGCFIPAASISTVSSGLAIMASCCKNNNDGQSLSTFQKVYNTVVNVLPNIGVNLALAGVINMSKIYLNEHQDNNNKHDVETSFYLTASGIGIVSGGILVNTILQLKKNWRVLSKNINENPIFDSNSVNVTEAIISQNITTTNRNQSNSPKM